MPNGKDYILFYMKLLVESISHEGKLRFSDRIPYNDDMLATITDTNIDIVRSAVKIFTELELMTMEDDGTIYMIEVMEMMGSETDWAEKKRLYRSKKVDLIETDEGQKRTMSDKSKRLELDIELERDIDNKEGNKPPRYNPSDDLVFFNDSDFQEVWKDYKAVRTRKKASNSDRAIKSIIKKLVDYSGDCKQEAINIIAKSADSGWSDIYHNKDKQVQQEEIKEMPEGLKNLWN